MPQPLCPGWIKHWWSRPTRPPPLLITPKHGSCLAWYSCAACYFKHTCRGSASRTENGRRGPSQLFQKMWELEARKNNSHRPRNHETPVPKGVNDNRCNNGAWDTIKHRATTPTLSQHTGVRHSGGYLDSQADDLILVGTTMGAMLAAASPRR